MPDRQQAQEGDVAASRLVGTIVAALITLAWVVLARAAGLSWKGVLHWSGEALLIAGILLAAEGISQVRREWTRRPGWRELVRRRVRASAAQAGSPLMPGAIQPGQSAAVVAVFDTRIFTGTLILRSNGGYQALVSSRLSKPQA